MVFIIIRVQFEHIRYRISGSDIPKADLVPEPATQINAEQYLCKAVTLGSSAVLCSLASLIFSGL